MKIWLIKDGEPLPVGSNNDRLLRIGILANTLGALDHQVTWWSSTFNHHKKIFRNTKNISEKYSKNLTINQIHSPGYKKNISFKRMFHNFVVAKRFNRLAKQSEKPDVILCCLPTIELAKRAVEYANSYNIPVIIDLRDMWPDIFLYSVPSKLRWLARIIFFNQFKQMRYVCANATNLVGVSEGFLQWGLEYAGRVRNVDDEVFPLGYVDMFHADSMMRNKENIFWEKYGLSREDFIIVYAGSLSSKINFEPIIEAVSEIGPCVKLVIAGLGDTYKDLVRETRDIDNIILTGWLNKDQLSGLLDVAKIGLYPYPNRKDFSDHLPNKFIEYLCSGTLVLSRVDSFEMKSFFEKYSCGFTYTDNVDSLVKLIKELIFDKDKLEKLSRYARQTYIEKFDAKNVYGRMANYIECLARRK